MVQYALWSHMAPDVIYYTPHAKSRAQLIAGYNIHAKRPTNEEKFTPVPPLRPSLWLNKINVYLLE